MKQTFVALTLAAAAPISAAAQPNVDREVGAPVIAAFDKYCLDRPNDIGAIVAANNVDTSLRSSPVPAEFMDKKVDVSGSWNLTLGGRFFELIVWHRFKNSGIQCMLRSPDQADTIFPYIDPFKRTVRMRGLEPKQTDLPNLFITRGKIADGRSAEARLLTKFALPKWQGRYIALWALYA